MTKQVLFLAVCLAIPSVGNATIIGFGELGGSNAPVPKDLGSRATENANGLVVSNGTTPNITVTWDVNGEQNDGGSGNGWDIHTSGFFDQVEETTIGGGAWDNEGNTQRIAQLDFGLHTIGFGADPGAQLVLNSFDFGHTGETAGVTNWDLVLTDSASNVAWNQSVTFTNGMTQTISPNFIGAVGEDYVLSFTRTSETYGSNGRHAIDNLSFSQLPDLSNAIGALVINRSGAEAGTASISADQAFAIGDYEIRSASGALNPSGWTSITGTNADPADDWSVVNETAFSLLEEDGPAGPNDGLSLAGGGEYDLGQAFSILPTFFADGETPTNWEDAVVTVRDDSGTLLAVNAEYQGTSVPFGDYNGDLVIDIQDWPLFRAGLGGDYSELTAAQAYLNGDLDGDLDSDIHDYNLFVELAGGSSALFAVAVPEPSTVALAMLASVAALKGRRGRAAALVTAFAVATLGVGSASQAQTLQGFSVVGSTPTTSIPAGQQNENENAGPEQLFDDSIINEPGQIAFDLFSTNYTDPELFPGGFLGQYAIGGETPGETDSAVVFMDYGSSVTADWFAYAQRTGGNPVADKVGKFEFWFSDTDFAGVVPAGSPDATVNLLSGDNRIDDSTIRPYSLGGDHTGRYVAMRITETAESSALTSTSRIGGHEFRLLDGPTDVVLTVDRSSGELTLRNNLPGAENIFMSGYTIESPGGALTTESFDGLGGDAMFPLGDGSGDGWELADGSNANRLAEAFFGGQTSFTAGASPISLGNAYDGLSGVEDLVFLWTNQQGEVYNARVEYIGEAPLNLGDFNSDGFVNAADYAVWRDFANSNATLPNDASPGSVGADDYLDWSSSFGASAQAAIGESASVPEPAAALMAVLSVLLACVDRRR